MLFDSIEFIIFFSIVFLLYFIVPRRYRWAFLLICSYIFYANWKVEYVLLLLGTTLFNYFLGLRLAAEKRPRYRHILVYLSIGANLAVLFLFKYFDFFIDSLRSVLNVIGVADPPVGLNLLVPIGISFYSLQMIGYTIDIYQGKTQPSNDLGAFALFVSFFPQIAAGPIARADNLLPQLHNEISFDYDRVVSGLQRMGWGVFKKLVIADRLAIAVNLVYEDPTRYTGLPLILATYAFAFQIYCDFSAYSDIALGAARVLGFHLKENFTQPYFSVSVVEFWRRWHISLSSWLRDYIFFPFSRAMLRRFGSHNGLLIQVAAYLITMLASGVWHGASWTFVVWGGIHGLLIALTVLWQRTSKPQK